VAVSRVHGLAATLQTYAACDDRVSLVAGEITADVVVTMAAAAAAAGCIM